MGINKTTDEWIEALRQEINKLQNGLDNLRKDQDQLSTKTDLQALSDKIDRLSTKLDEFNRNSSRTSNKGIGLSLVGVGGAFTLFTINPFKGQLFDWFVLGAELFIVIVGLYIFETGRSIE